MMSRVSDRYKYTSVTCRVSKSRYAQYLILDAISRSRCMLSWPFSSAVTTQVTRCKTSTDNSGRPGKLKRSEILGCSHYVFNSSLLEIVLKNRAVLRKRHTLNGFKYFFYESTTGKHKLPLKWE